MTGMSTLEDESVDPRFARTMIDLRTALKHHRQCTSIDALYEISNPKHYSIPPPTHITDTATLQIYMMHTSQGSRSQARAPRRAHFQCLNVTRRQLVDGAQGFRVESQRPPWRVIPALPAPRGQMRLFSAHGWIRGPLRCTRKRWRWVR